MKVLRILGTRGVPASHGGFETFAEQFARYLAPRGWRVTVYCQREGCGAISEDMWHGIRRVHVPVTEQGPPGTIIYDWKCIVHARREPGVILTLGYNTAFFSLLYLGRGLAHLMNMDGIEYQRAKWSWPVKVWFYLNEIAGCKLSTHLIADNPHIKTHLLRWAKASRITMIPYASKPVTCAWADVLPQYALVAKRYALIIARPEPENSILELVQAFSQKPRRLKLVILGNYRPDENSFHRRVREAASDEVCFPGAIYDSQTVDVLRCHAALYLHGHQVGGTNPSLIEALAAGMPVMAHDNRFNRWVAEDAAVYFRGVADASRIFDELDNQADALSALSPLALARHAARFTPEKVLADYETLILAAAQGAFDRAPVSTLS